MITYRAGDIKDVRLGDTAITSVCVGAVEVWNSKPKGTRWIHIMPGDRIYYCEGDVTNVYTTGWLNNDAPDLSAFGPPAKGSILLNGVLDTVGRIIGTCFIFDGTMWTTTQEEMRPDFTLDSQAPTSWVHVHWLNMPGPTDIQDVLDMAGGGELHIVISAQADGIHYRLMDANAKTVDFTKPYPAGITAADLPPTMNDVTP